MIDNRNLLLGLFAVLGISACSSLPFWQNPNPFERPLSDEAQTLLEVDQAFAARSLEVGAPQAFREYMDEFGMHLPASGNPIVGNEAIQQKLLKNPSNVLSWIPRYAEVFSGGWGWTWGDWQLHEPGAGGRRLDQGRYVNLWIFDRDRGWKVRLDMGNSAPVPAPR